MITTNTNKVLKESYYPAKSVGAFEQQYGINLEVNPNIKFKTYLRREGLEFLATAIERLDKKLHS
jgi:hypothetical protein